MANTTVTETMRDKALATAAEIILFAQTAAQTYPGGYDLSLATLRTADPLTYREVLDAVCVLEMLGMAQTPEPGLCTIFAVRRR